MVYKMKRFFYFLVTPDGLFHLEKEDSGKKTCAFLYGGDTLKRAENTSFAEARDMCAMEILKCEEYRAAYVDWVEKAYSTSEGMMEESEVTPPQPENSGDKIVDNKNDGSSDAKTMKLTE